MCDAGKFMGKWAPSETTSEITGAVCSEGTLAAILPEIDPEGVFAQMYKEMCLTVVVEALSTRSNKPTKQMEINQNYHRHPNNPQTKTPKHKNQQKLNIFRRERFNWAITHPCPGSCAKDQKKEEDPVYVCDKGKSKGRNIMALSSENSKLQADA